MIGKSVYLLTFLVTIATVVNCELIAHDHHYAAKANESHHLIVGYRQPGDRLVLKEHIIKKSKWLQIVTEQKIFSVSKSERITLIQALDQKINGKGARASILNGGPGDNSVELRFKSQRGHGINFIVELYARP